MNSKFNESNFKIVVIWDWNAWKYEMPKLKKSLRSEANVSKMEGFCFTYQSVLHHITVYFFRTETIPSKNFLKKTISVLTIYLDYLEDVFGK